MGLNLLMVSVSTWSDSSQSNSDAFDDARKMLLDAQLQSPQTLSTQPAESLLFPKAGLRVLPPTGWIADLHDATDGIVATFHDPNITDNKILLLIQPIPEDIQHKPEARAALIDDLDRRAQGIYPSDPNRSGTPRQINDRRFIRKTITQHHRPDGRVEVCCRMVRADQVLIEVISISHSEQSRQVMKLADELAVQIKPVNN
jgi:hypothetical protein